MAVTITGIDGFSTVVSGAGMVYVGGTPPAPQRVSPGEFPRYVEGLVGINGKNIWGDIKQYNTSLVYTDVATGAADSFDITLFDLEEKFIDQWLVDDGTALNAQIKFVNWNKEGETNYIECGEFLTDSTEIHGFPFEIDIKSVAVPVRGTEKTKKWENITIAKIAQDIANGLGVGLEYYAANLTLKSRQQSRQSDINFLFSLCTEYGFGMRVYRNKIIIFDRAARDAETPVNAGNPYMVKEIADSVSVIDSTEGVYTGVRAVYKPEKAKKDQEVFIGTKDKYLTIDNAGSSQKEAEIKAKAALYNKNVERVKLKMTIKDYYPFYAGVNYYFYGLGKYSGAYGIDKVTHTLNSHGYTAKLEAHAIALEKDR